LDSILGVALIAVTIHLMVAGGWTVPGVAIVFWLCSAMLARCDSSIGTGSRPKPVALALAAGCSLAILAALYFMSLRPVEARKRLMAAAARAQSTGQLGKAKLSLQRAVGVDPWSPDAVLWVADFYRWKIILGAENPLDRQQWNASLLQAKQRAGDDPAIYRMIGAQQLHVYQRHGNAVDLQAAAETFQMAVDWSPSNQWMIAQMAVVAQARGEIQKARMLGNRALDLSLLGGNIERALSRQQVYVARPLGKAADRGPIRRGASELLSEPATH
jgi:tetratricopeptide (TPR) repeat protein